MSALARTKSRFRDDSWIAELGSYLRIEERALGGEAAVRNELAPERKV